MRFRTTLVLFALTAALVIFIKFYETKRPNTEEANRRAQNVINFERDKIEGVVIQNGEERIELKRADKKWRLESPVKDLADGSTVENLLFDLEDWKKDATISGKEIESDKNKLSEFGVAKAKLRLKLLGQKVNDLIAQITTSRIAQFIADDAGDLHPYGLAEPRGTVTIFTADDKSGG